MEHTRRKIPKEEVGKDVFDPPDERSASALDEVIAADAFRKLLDQVKGDQDLELVLYCVEDGLSKATDIADALTMPIERVYKAKRKLGLILKNMRENNDG